MVTIPDIQKPPVNIRRWLLRHWWPSVTITRHSCLRGDSEWARSKNRGYAFVGLYTEGLRQQVGTNVELQ